jgi:predicted CXXCH cytochrome family protein
MNTWQGKLKSIGAAAILLCAMAWTGASAQVSGISNTPHNLSPTGPGNKFNGAAANAEICAFCHTPHGSNDTVSAPLWNRVNGSATYTTYSSTNSTTIDGAVAPVGSVSIACLSCHDGTQAMDTVINQPGSDGYSAGGARMGADTDWSVSATMPAGIANLGGDLTNDHPIGIQYGGGDIAGTGLTPKDPDFKAPATSGTGNAQVWWVDTTGGTADREKTDMILYSRNETTVAGGRQPFVECASCHDPHTDQQATFLRISNQASAVCLACHTK